MKTTVFFSILTILLIGFVVGYPIIVTVLSPSEESQVISTIKIYNCDFSQTEIRDGLNVSILPCAQIEGNTTHQYQTVRIPQGVTTQKKTPHKDNDLAVNTADRNKILGYYAYPIIRESYTEVSVKNCVTGEITEKDPEPELICEEGMVRVPTFDVYPKGEVDGNTYQYYLTGVDVPSLIPDFEINKTIGGRNVR